MARESIFAEIERERSYQNEKWGVETDDTLNNPWMWAAYICQYATRWMAGTFLPFGPSLVDSFRTSMIKVASIAIAAVESLDRQRETNGRAFYEENTNGEG